MARGAGHDLNGLGDQIIAKLEEIYNKEVQINNTTVAPKTDASGLESLDKTATRVYKNLQGLSNAKPKANLFTTLDDSANNLKKTWNNLVKDVGKGKLSEVDLYNPTTKTNPQGNAVLKAANVYEALGGKLEDLSNQQIANYVKTMRGNPANVTNQRFSVENLKEAFSIFKEGRALLKDPVFHENKRSGSIFYANEIEKNFSSFQNYNEEVAKAVDHTLSLSDALKEANEKRAISAQTQRKRILTEQEILEEGGRLLEEEKKQEEAKQKASKRKKTQTKKTVPVTEQTSESSSETIPEETTPVTTTARTKKTTTKKRASKKVTSKSLEQTGAETVQNTQAVIEDTVQQGAEDAAKETSSLEDTKKWVKEQYAKTPLAKNFSVKAVREALEENYKQTLKDGYKKNGETLVTQRDKYASKLTDEQLNKRISEIPKKLQAQAKKISDAFSKQKDTVYGTYNGTAVHADSDKYMDNLEAEMNRYNDSRASLSAMKKEMTRRKVIRAKQEAERTKLAEEQARQVAAQTEQAKEETKEAEKGVATARVETKKAQERKANAEQRADTAKTEAKEAEKEAKQEERATTQSGTTKTPPSNRPPSPPNNPPKGGNIKPPSYNWDEFTKIDKEEFDKVLAAYRISGHKNANDEIKEIRKNVSAKKDNVTTTYGVVDKQGNIVTGEMKRGRFVYDSQGQRTTSKYTPPKEQEQPKKTQVDTSKDADNLTMVNNLLEKQKSLYAEIQQLKLKISTASTTGATQEETDKLKQELAFRQKWYENNKQIIQDLKDDSSKEAQKTMTQQEKEVTAFEKTYAQSQSAYQKGFEANYQRIQDAMTKATALDKNDPLLAQASQLMQKISDPKAMGFSENNGKELAKNIKAETDAIVKSLQERNKALNAQNVRKNRDELLGQKDYLSQLGYGQLDEKSMKVGSDGTATLSFIKNLGDSAVTTTLKIKDLNIALQQMKQGTYQDALKTGQDSITLQNKAIQQATAKDYEKLIKPYIQARTRQASNRVLTSAEEQTLSDFDEKYIQGMKGTGVTEAEARHQVNTQALINMENELSNAIGKAWDKAGGKVEAYKAKLQEIEGLLEQLKNSNLNLWDDKSVATTGALYNTIQDNLRPLNTNDYDFASDTSRTNLLSKMQKWASFNTKAMQNSEYKDRYNFIAESVSNVDTSKSVKDVRQLGVAFDQLTIDVNKANMAGYSFADMWKQRLTNFGTYLASYASMYRIWATIKQGVSTVTELDTALTEMRKVSDESLTSLKQYQVESFNLASNVGTTALQIQNSTADWMRLGESMDEASESAQASAVLMNVSEFQSIDEATTSLVSMSAAYSNMDKMDIIDKLNNIGNNFSISTDGIATALQNSASALTTANNDIDEAIALITAGNAVVQDPKKVGAGIRTIALRIQGTEQAKEELKSLGEDTDDYIVGTKSKINEQVKAFTAVASNEFKGVSLLDENGNYRSTYEILQDIADIYDEIQETDKKYGTNHEQGLLELLAGKNRSNIAASILQNGDMLRDVYESSQMSAGSAQEENEKYLDSVNGKMAQMKNEFQDLAFSALDSDSLKGLIEGATKFLDILNNIIKTLGSLPTVLSIAFAGFSASKGYSLIGKGDKSLTGNLFNYFTKKAYNKTGSETAFFQNIGTNYSTDNIDYELTKSGSRNLNSWVTFLGNGNKTKGIENLAQNMETIDKTALETGSGLKGVSVAAEDFNQHMMIAGKGATKFQLALQGVKTVASTFASTMLSMGVAMAASWVIGKGVQWISDWIHQEEIAIEKGEEAQTALESASKAYKDINTTVTNLGKTYNQSGKEISTSSEAIDSLTKKYYELRKGVDANTNKNISLSDEDYQSYLDISNQLAETFPIIKSGSDEAGNAILNIGNNAGEASDKLKELLDAERAVANLEIKDNFADTFEKSKLLYRDYQSKIEDTEDEIEEKQEEFNKPIVTEGIYKGIDDKGLKILKESFDKAAEKHALGFGYNYVADYVESTTQEYDSLTGNWSTSTNIDFDKLRTQFGNNQEAWHDFVSNFEGEMAKQKLDIQDDVAKLQSEADSYTSQQKNEYNQQLDFVKSLLQTDSIFLDSNADVAQGILNNLENNKDFSMDNLIGRFAPDSDEAVDYIYDTIIDPLYRLEEPAQKALADILSLDSNTLSYSGYTDRVNALIETGFGDRYSDDAYEWKKRLGIDNVLESYESNLETAKTKVKGLDNALEDLSGEDLQLVANMDTDDSIITIADLKSKIQELRKEAEDPIPVTIEEAIKEEDSTFTAAQKAQESANSGATYDTMFSMYKTAKELVEKGDIGTDDFQKIAAMFSPSGAKDLENWNENLGKIKSYFTEDNSGLKNFLNDLKDKGFADFDEKLKSWTLNLGDMEKAAREMGIGYEPFLAILGELKDKGFTNDFFADAASGGQLLGDLTNQLYEAQKELDDLHTYDGENKTAIDAKEKEIESLQERIEATSKSLDELLNKEPEEVVTEKNGARDRMQERLKAFNKTSKQYTGGEGKQAMKTYGEAVVQALQKEGFVNAGLREGKNGAWKIDLDVNTKDFETKSKYKDVKKGGKEDRDYYNKYKDLMTEDERETYTHDWSIKQRDKGNLDAGVNIQGKLVEDTEKSNQKVIDQYLDLYKSGKDYSEMQEELTQSAEEQGTSLDNWIKKYSGEDAFKDYQDIIEERLDWKTLAESSGEDPATDAMDRLTDSNNNLIMDLNNLRGSVDSLNETLGGNPPEEKDKERDSNRRLPEDGESSGKSSGKPQDNPLTPNVDESKPKKKIPQLPKQPYSSPLSSPEGIHKDLTEKKIAQIKKAMKLFAMGGDPSIFGDNPYNTSNILGKNTGKDKKTGGFNLLAGLSSIADLLFPTVHANAAEIDAEHNYDDGRIPLDESINAYCEELDRAKEANVDFSKAVYGNIDTDNRQKLYWTDENRERYASAARSWGMDTSEFKDYSTVLGMWGNFGENGSIPIAFTPMLQTESGTPELLDQDTVNNYIDEIVSQATEDGQVNPLKLFDLDAQGMDIDGQHISNLIAGIGDEADLISQQMHYSGETGSLFGIAQGIQEELDASGMSINDFLTEYGDKIPDELKKALTEAKVGEVGKDGFEVEMDVDQKKVEKKLKKLKKGQSLEFTADVEGIEQEVEAVTDEEGKIHYYTNIDDVKVEVEPVVNEDGSVTYKPITDDLPKEMPEIPQDVKQQAVPDKSVTTPPDPVEQQVKRTVVNETKQVNSDAAPKSATVNYKKGEQEGAQDNTANVNYKLGDQDKPKPQSTNVNYKLGSQASPASKSATVNYTASASDQLKNWTPPKKKGVVEYTGTGGLSGTAHISGTARASGTAFAKGTLSNEQTDNVVRSNSWKTSKPMNALTGEVGQELVVTGNRWFTVGDNGAEFAHIPKGAVVFNAKQTEQLFSKGYINSRGKVNGQLRYPSSSAHFLDGSIDDDLDALDEVDSLDAFLTGNAFYNRATGPDLGGGGGGTTKKKDTSSKKTTSKGKGKGKKGKGKSKGKSKKDKKWDAFEKWLDSLFDWMEIRLDRLSRKTEKWSDAAENAVTLSSEGGTWGEGGAKTTRKLGTKKNPINYTTYSMDSATNKEIQATRKEYKANKNTEKLYNKRAKIIKNKATGKNKDGKYILNKKQRASVRKAYKALKSGKRIDITKYGEKTRAVIEEMQEWIEKGLDAGSEALKKEQELADQYRQRFDNIQDWYEMVRGLYSDKASTEESFINARVAKGEKIYRGDYQNQLDNLETVRKKSIAEYNALYKEFSTQVKAGRVVEGTSVWYEMRDELEKAEAQVYDDTEALASLNDEIDQLELEHLQDVIDRISSVIDRLSEMGDVIQDIGDTTWNTALPNLKTLYKNEAVRTGQEYTALNNKRNEIISQMENKEVGSEQWNKLKEELDSTDSSLISIIKNLTEINEKNRELNWKPFEDGMEDLEHYRDELSTIQDFLNEDNLVGKNGLLTTEGWANIALMAKQMELSEDAIYNNRKALEKLEEEYKNGVISQDKLTEESRKYCDAIADEARNLEDYKSKVLDAYLDSLEKQNDLLQENIDKRKDALSKVKDYYDYQRTISEKSKDINYLQQQIAALDGVSNKAAQAKLASLRDELAEAQLDMNDTVYDHEYELRTEGLDSLSEDVQTAFDNMTERLQRNHDERDKLLSELLTPVGDKSTEIATLLQGVIDANGLIVEITDKDKNSLKADLISAESIKALDEFSDSILNFKDFNASTELTKVAEQLTAISNLDTTSVYSNLKNFKEIYNKIVEIGTNNTTYEDKGKKPNGNSSTVPDVGKKDPKPNSSNKSAAKKTNNQTETKTYTKEQKANYKTRIDGYLARNGTKYNKKAKYGDFNTALGKKTGFVLDEKHRKDLAKHLGVTYNNDKKTGNLYQFFVDVGYFKKPTKIKTTTSSATIKYAKGSKNIPKDMLGITQDEGQEVIYRKSDGAMLTPLGKGDKVFTAQMTDNLWKLAQNASLNNNGLSNLSAPIINNINTSSPTININFENFMTVQGNVDKEAITDIKKFKSEMVDEFTRTMTNEMNLLGHKFRF